MINNLYFWENNFYLWEIFVNFVESSVVTYFIFSRLSLSGRSHRRVAAVLFSLFFTVLVTLLNFLQGSAAVTQTVSYVFRLIIIMCCFRNSIAEKIFAACVPSFMCMLAEQFTYTVGILIDNFILVDGVFTAEHPSYDYLGDHPVVSTLLYLFFEIVFVVTFVRILNNIIHLSSKVYIFLIIVTNIALISTAVFLNTIVEMKYCPLPMERRLHLNTLCFIVMFLFITMVVLVQIIGNTYQRNLTLIEQLHQNEMIEERNKSLLQSVESLRQWKHDYKNHLQVMQELLAGEKYDQLKGYIAEQKEKLPQSFPMISTGHNIIDAILTGKCADVQANNIFFEYSVILPDQIPLSDIEITGILGNLLDNAIEACKIYLAQCSGVSGQPFIRAEIKPQRSMVHICVKNTSHGSYFYDKNGDLETTKEDKLIHGNGLRQVRTIVESHGGFYKIAAGDEEFTVDVFIPLKKQEGDIDVAS